MDIDEYDGPTAWADMSAVEKMRAVLEGEAEANELDLYRQAISEAANAERRHADALAENRRLRAEVERLRVNADDRERALRWIAGDDSGASSEAIALHMAGMKPRRKYVAHPHDPDDLGRCLRLLRQVPSWACRIGEMAAYSPEWAALCDEWGSLAAMMQEEVGIDWDKGDRAPITYAAMRAAIDAARGVKS